MREHAVIAAIYARKSTEQNSVADDQRSVTRQIAHARAYATSKGWTVEDASVFVDDGISGAGSTGGRYSREALKARLDTEAFPR